MIPCSSFPVNWKAFFISDLTMAEAATHLVENVLPMVSYRQNVVSFPIPMRYWLQSNTKLYVHIHQLMIREIHRYYMNSAKALVIKDQKPGSVSITQRWGSTLNLNVHAHILCPDGVYIMVGDVPRFKNLEPISNEEVANLLGKIAASVMLYLKKKGFFNWDWRKFGHISNSSTL